MKTLIATLATAILLTSCGTEQIKFHEAIVKDDRFMDLCKKQDANFEIDSDEAIIIMKEHGDEVYDQYGIGWLYEPISGSYTNGYAYFLESDLEGMVFYSCTDIKITER